MLNILGILQGIGWGRIFNYGAIAWRFLSRFRGGRGAFGGRGLSFGNAFR